MRLKTNLLFGLLCVSPFGAGAQQTLSMEQAMALMQQNMCLGCHQIDKRRVGPAFANIADRYGGTTERDATINVLMNSIQNGGRGRWGAIPMPAQPQVTDEEARDMAAFILTLQQKPE
jgi:cytochrome c